MMIGILVVLFLLAVLVVLPIWVINKVNALQLKQQELQLRVSLLEIREARAPAPAPSAPTGSVQPAATTPAPVVVKNEPPPAPAVTPPAKPVQLSEPPVVPAIPRPVVVAPPLSAPAPAPSAKREEPRAVDWEQFMGAKLFAWLGGLALLLCVAFFIKYSFEHNLIPPEARVTLGFIFGAGLIVGGLMVPRPRYEVTGFTLIGTGVVSLYAVTFACHAYYHFAPFGLITTFGVMTVITALAFGLAVRLEARVVAVLGLLGGFLTPVLLSTGVDNPAGLFSYIALLDAGLIAVALRRRWPWLVPLGAAGTIFMQLGWVREFYTADKLGVAVTVLTGFNLLFFLANEVARRLARPAREIAAAAVALPFVTFAIAFYFILDPATAAQPGLLFGGVLVADAVLLALAWREQELGLVHVIGGGVTFGMLALWSSASLTEALLLWALGCYLAHGLGHTGFAVMLERHRPGSSPGWVKQVFLPLAVILMLWPLGKLAVVPWALWPCMLLVDLAAMGLALLAGSLAVVLSVLVLTVIATMLWLFQLPASADSLPEFLAIITGFAVVFFAAGVLLPRRLGAKLSPGMLPAGWRSILGDQHTQLPAFAALMPFMLLAVAVVRLPLPDPTLILGVALLLVVLLLGLSAAGLLTWLPACALAGLAGVEYAWRGEHEWPVHPGTPLGWYLGFVALFAAYPFVFRRKFAASTGPWAVAALAGMVQFPLVYQIMKHSWPWEWPGLVPALFALPPLVSLILVRRAPVADEGARLNQLAWYGAAVLFFVTLIIPIQFERQWITLGWALEGAALLWLFHRIPHIGLRLVGVALLIVAFGRLTLHPAVLARHLVAEGAPLNWQLYTYGLVTLCLWTGARLLTPVKADTPGRDLRPLLNALGVVLAFLLLNIELAEFFSAPGQRVFTFEFTRNLARDMATTIGWACFALGLLLASVWRAAAYGRYAALGLLGVVLLKLFFHDLAELSALYRIGAFFAVAVIAIVASVIYQRFVPARKTPGGP